MIKWLLKKTLTSRGTLPPWHVFFARQQLLRLCQLLHIEMNNLLTVTNTNLTAQAQVRALQRQDIFASLRILVYFKEFRRRFCWFNYHHAMQLMRSLIRSSSTVRNPWSYIQHSLFSSIDLQGDVSQIQCSPFSLIFKPTEVFDKSGEIREIIFWGGEGAEEFKIDSQNSVVAFHWMQLTPARQLWLRDYNKHLANLSLSNWSQHNHSARSQWVIKKRSGGVPSRTDVLHAGERKRNWYICA